MIKFLPLPIMTYILSRGRSLLLCITGALILMYACFYNGYPIYEGDTHAYIGVAFTDAFPNDRTPFYSYFLRISSFWESLWYTIFFQCLLLSYLLLRYIRHLNNSAPFSWTGIISIVVIASFTCVSWISSKLMPDIFTGTLLVAVLLYLFDKSSARWQKAVYLVIIFLIISIHNSHFLITALFSGSIFLYSIVCKNKELIKKSLALMCVSVLFYFTMCSINQVHGYGFVFCPAAPVFTMAKLASNGILDVYLEDNCDKKNLRLCSCKGQLPEYPWNFMWPSAPSPLLKIGIEDSCKNEFKEIIYDIFTNPKYLKLYIQKSGISTMRQLVNIQVMNTLPYDKESSASKQNKTWFMDENKDFCTSKQNCNTIELSSFNLVYTLFFIITTIWIFLIYRQTTDGHTLHIYYAILLFFLINAFVSSSFSAIHYRFQARIFWLLPATNAILILKYLQARFSATQKPSLPINP